jgi:uncharacterized phosphatase
MKKLYFVRHGLSEMNVSGYIAGRTESPLADEGRQQARDAGQHAKTLAIDYIVCSPQGRAVETAQIIAKEIGYPLEEIHINNLFMERHFGELEGKKWAPDLNLDGISDIETLDTLLERAKLALEWLHTIDAHNILVVSHGSFGRALRNRAKNEKEEHFVNKTSSEATRIPNAQIIQWI